MFTYLGYSHELTPKDAEELTRAIKNAEQELYSSGGISEVALRLFATEASVLTACNIPGIGPAVALYLSYETGRYAKAAEIVNAVETWQSIYLSDLLHLAALSMALAESLYVTLVLFKRERWEILETAAIIIFELSLAALASVLEASLP